jgi:hypothetical protein
MSPKDAVSPLGFVPSDKHRADIQQSWFGTLLGQATVAVGMVVAYLGAIGFLYQYVGDALDRLQASNPIIFYGGIGLPLVLVGTFSVLPTILRARREARLRPLSRNPTPPEPGYFRLHPYGAADKKKYHRPDGALDQAKEWLKRTEATVLYLSGASGSGKSSLVEAGLVPALEEDGWATLLVRGMGSPLTALTKALQDADELFPKPQSSRTGLRTLLTRAGEERARVNTGPLLIVMDQFEEFLLLEEGAEKVAYSEFLTELAKDPVPNIRLLHVFRSDYRELIFREGLPDYLDGQTAFSIPAFTRSYAEAFLNDGPVQMDRAGYDALFAGLDRIEDARGLYRPITLNMIGFVLERQGSSLAAEPSRLIELYLRDCISSSASKDFAKPVLEALITREGTKAPQQSGDIADTTKLEAWQVSATLTDLQRQGLARPVAGVWEISHDFLARLIGQITGRIRKPWFRRAASPTLIVAGIGWLIAMGAGVPAWVQWQENRAMSGIAALGFSQEPSSGTSLHLVARDGSLITKETLSKLSHHAKAAKPISVLSLEASSLTNLSGIEGLTALTSLDLRDANNLTSLSGIESLTALTSLNLSGARSLTNLSGIEGLTALTSLNLGGARSLTNLSGIEGLTALTYLDLSSAISLTSLSGIEGLTALTTLKLRLATNLKSLSGIEGLTALTSLDLSYAISLTSLSGIEGLTALTSLNLSFSRSLNSLSGIEGLLALNSLDLSDASSLTSLSGIEGLTALTSLDLSGASSLTNLSGIEGLTALTSLNLLSINTLTSLENVDCAFLRAIPQVSMRATLWETCDD